MIASDVQLWRNICVRIFMNEISVMKRKFFKTPKICYNIRIMRVVVILSEHNGDFLKRLHEF